LSVEHKPNAAGAAPVRRQNIAGEVASATRCFLAFMVDQIAIWIGLLILQIAYVVAFEPDTLDVLKGLIFES